MSGSTELADLTARLQQATAELTIREVSGASLQVRLVEAAIPLGMSVYLGTIAFAGQDAAGSYQVQVDDPATNTGYLSDCPQWAFEPAQAALLAGRKVLLVATGNPFGSNLVTVLILS